MLIFLFSCSGDKTVFEEYRKFDDMSWNRFNNLTFKANIDNVDKLYTIYLNIRHIPEVPYEEMVINMSIYSPSGDLRTNDYTLNFTDSNDNRLSDCLGDFCDLLIPIREDMQFYEAGILKIEIENKFTKIEMPGIMEVGLIIKSGQEIQ